MCVPLDHAERAPAHAAICTAPTASPSRRTLHAPAIRPPTPDFAGSSLGRAPATSSRAESLGVLAGRCSGFAASASLDDLVRPRQQRRRDREAERLGGLEVDHELELGGLLDGQIARLRALEDLVDIRCGPSHQIGRP
jgi:hypothetical protein